MTIIELVEKESGETGLTIDSKFDEIDLDSLEFVELMLQVQSEFGVTIPDALFAKLKSISDLETMVAMLKWEERSESIVSS